jgi:hypothetical protein
MLTIIFGGNKFIETNGLVTFVDEANGIRKELFKVELRDDMHPMITVEIRDASDGLIGKAYKSTSFVAVNPDYEPITERNESEIKRMALKKKDSGFEVFEMVNKGISKISVNNKLVDNYTVEINGTFHVKGVSMLVRASKDKVQVGTNSFVGCTKMGGNFGIILTPNGFRL